VPDALLSDLIHPVGQARPQHMETLRATFTQPQKGFHKLSKGFIPTLSE